MMRGHLHGSRPLIAAGVVAVLFAGGCTGLGGGDVPGASLKGPFASTSEPSATTPSPSEPSTATSSPAAPALPRVKSRPEASDPQWLGVAPPVVFEALGTDKPLGDGFESLGVDEDPLSAVLLHYQRPGEAAYVTFKIKEGITVPPESWVQDISTMIDPRQEGISVCYLIVVAELPRCVAFAENLPFTAESMGRREDIPVEVLEPMLQELIGRLTAS